MRVKHVNQVRSKSARCAESNLTPRTLPCTPGPLPRIIGDPGPLKTASFVKDTEWHKSEALFGQNDYIDILGEGSIKPRRLLFNMPAWLRGFRGNELQMLNRKRFIVDNWKALRPKKYENMKKRVDFLYRWMNMKKKPPEFEKY